MGVDVKTNLTSESWNDPKTIQCSGGGEREVYEKQQQ